MVKTMHVNFLLAVSIVFQHSVTHISIRQIVKKKHTQAETERNLQGDPKKVNPPKC